MSERREETWRVSRQGDFTAEAAACRHICCWVAGNCNVEVIQTADVNLTLFPVFDCLKASLLLPPSFPPPSLILPPSFCFSIFSPPSSVSPQGSLSCCFKLPFISKSFVSRWSWNSKQKKNNTINPLQLRWRRCPLGNLYWFRWLQKSDSRASSVIKSISQQKENGSETISIICSLFMSYFKQKCQTFSGSSFPTMRICCSSLSYIILSQIMYWIEYFCWTVGLTK